MSITRVMKCFGPGAQVFMMDDGACEKLIVRNIAVEVNPLGPPDVHMDCSVVDAESLGISVTKRPMPIPARMKAKKVVYNPPATIVLWEDGTKTVVKCDLRDDYDPKYGLALCYMKKALGNTSRALNDVLHREEGKG